MRFSSPILNGFPISDDMKQYQSLSKQLFLLEHDEHWELNVKVSRGPFPPVPYSKSQKKGKKMLVPLMWIQNAAHFVPSICINIVFFMFRLFQCLRGFLLLSMVYYPDAHVKPLPLPDTRKSSMSA